MGVQGEEPFIVKLEAPHISTAPSKPVVVFFPSILPSQPASHSSRAGNDLPTEGGSVGETGGRGCKCTIVKVDHPPCE